MHDAGGGAGAPSGLRLDPSWPGLRVPDGKVEVDPDALDEFADALEREADFLESGATGTPMKLRTEGTLPPGAFGTWATATEMEYGYVHARDYVAHYYEQLVVALRNAALQARATADEHRGVDAANRSGFDSQQSALGSGGPSVRTVI